MKKVLFLFLFQFLFFVGMSQSTLKTESPYTYSITAEYKLGAGLLRNFINYENEGWLAVFNGWESPTYSFISFSEKLKVLGANSLNLGDNKKDTWARYRTVGNKKYYHVYDVSKKDGYKLNIYDFSQKKTDGLTPIVTAISPQKEVKIRSHSTDGSKIAFSYSLIDETTRKLNNPVKGVIVADSAWNILYQKEIELHGYRKRAEHNRDDRFVQNNHINTTNFLSNKTSTSIIKIIGMEI